MTAFLYYPGYLTMFWFRDVLGSVVRFFIEFNRYVLSLLSFYLLLKTFFKPLKNEYRSGLVLFSTIFGIAIKSFIIGIDLGILLFIFALESIVLIFLLLLPIVLVAVAGGLIVI